MIGPNGKRHSGTIFTSLVNEKHPFFWYKPPAFSQANYGRFPLNQNVRKIWKQGQMVLKFPENFPENC